MDLIFDNLSLTLRDRLILRDISGHLCQGKVTAILGPNGAGKSSLLSCLAALRDPDQGSVKLGEQDVHGMPADKRAQSIGLLPQQADIHWDVDVKTLVALGRLPHQGRWGLSADDHAAIDRAMIAADCADLADRKALRLSGGEQARVLLARVLAGEPQWLLADEPLVSLDPAYQIDMLGQLKKSAQSGTGVVLVLHDLTQAARIADDVVILKEGKIIASGAASDILTADNLAKAYGVEVHISEGPTGEPQLIPVRRMEQK